MINILVWILKQSNFIMLNVFIKLSLLLGHSLVAGAHHFPNTDLKSFIHNSETQKALKNLKFIRSHDRTHPEAIIAFIYPSEYEYFVYCRNINVVDYQMLSQIPLGVFI